MESLKDRLARAEEEIAYLRRELQKRRHEVKNMPALVSMQNVRNRISILQSH
jgi:hypothetical protein